MDNFFFTYCCQHQTPGEEETRQAEYQETPQLHPVQDLSCSVIVVMKSYVESLVSTQGQGLLMCQTVRTTETPEPQNIFSIIIYLCGTDILKNIKKL